VKDDAVPRFGKGVKLRRDANGSAMLLVPETALELNGSAAAALPKRFGLTIEPMGPGYGEL